MHVQRLESNFPFLGGLELKDSGDRGSYIINPMWTEDPEYAYFCRSVRNASGIDLEKYKPHQMRRRLDSFRVRKGIGDYLTFAKIIEEKPDNLRELLDFLAINVSEFFRNPEQWKVLEEKVIPEILTQNLSSQVDSGKTHGVTGGRSTGPAIRAWSAGCSSGQEAYSLAAVLLEVNPGENEIVATDIDTESLEKAVKGVYSLKEASSIPPGILDKYFSKSRDSVWVKEELKSIVTFHRHNLLDDPYPKDFDLILCRNVLIYFSDEVKRDVLCRLRESLRPGGYLFVGASETILNPRSIGFLQEYPFFYRNKANP